VEGEPWKAHSATGLGSVKFFTAGETPVIDKAPHDLGRWPANLIHDGGEEVVGLTGDAARFFYCAKANKADRGENHHPTVKPTDLMRYLCRLVTPPGGVVLDPFTGSGSTGKASILEHFNFIGIEREAEYCEIARARISKAERDVSKELL
jgi:DNA modification methylase